MSGRTNSIHEERSTTTRTARTRLVLGSRLERLLHRSSRKAVRPSQIFVKRKKLRKRSKELLVSLAAGSHLFPFRTESLSPPAPMVLRLMPRESRSMPTQTTSPCHDTVARAFCFWRPPKKNNPSGTHTQTNPWNMSVLLPDFTCRIEESKKNENERVFGEASDRRFAKGRT